MPQAPFQERNPTIKDGKKSYTVKKGDNLTRYASRNNTTIEEIMKLNPHIKNKNKIYVGDQIVLPGDWNDDGSELTDEIITDIVDANNITNDVVDPNDAKNQIVENLNNRQDIPVSDTQADWNSLKADQKLINRRGRRNTLEFFDPTNTHDERMANIASRHDTRMDRIQNRWARRSARRDMRGERRDERKEDRKLRQDLRSMNPSRKTRYKTR